MQSRLLMAGALAFLLVGCGSTGGSAPPDVASNDAVDAAVPVGMMGCYAAYASPKGKRILTLGLVGGSVAACEEHQREEQPEHQRGRRAHEKPAPRDARLRGDHALGAERSRLHDGARERDDDGDHPRCVAPARREVASRFGHGRSSRVTDPADHRPWYIPRSLPDG